MRWKGSSDARRTVRSSREFGISIRKHPVGCPPDVPGRERRSIILTIARKQDPLPRNYRLQPCERDVGYSFNPSAYPMGNTHRKQGTALRAEDDNHYDKTRLSELVTKVDRLNAVVGFLSSPDSTEVIRFETVIALPRPLPPVPGKKNAAKKKDSKKKKETELKKTSVFPVCTNRTLLLGDQRGLNTSAK
eukprot:1126465-Amorphochlora_amoeboformis.AAC.1